MKGKKRRYLKEVPKLHLQTQNHGTGWCLGARSQGSVLPPMGIFSSSPSRTLLTDSFSKHSSTSLVSDVRHTGQNLSLCSRGKACRREQESWFGSSEVHFQTQRHYLTIYLTCLHRNSMAWRCTVHVDLLCVQTGAEALSDLKQRRAATVMHMMTIKHIVRKPHSASTMQTGASSTHLRACNQETTQQPFLPNCHLRAMHY